MTLAQKIQQALAAMFGGGNVPLSNRNLFVDGAFDAWTASNPSIGPTAGYNGPTMWITGAGAGGAGSLLQFDQRTSTAGLHRSTAMVFTQSTASTGTVAGSNAPYFSQKLEELCKFSGRSLTLQFKLWSTTGVTIPSIIFRANFGTGGSPSAGLTWDKAVNWVVGAAPAQTFSVRLDVPDLTGYTYGTNGGDYLQVGCWLPPGVTFAVSVGEAQLEFCSPNASSDLNGNGGTPTAFEYRGCAAETARLDRFFCWSGGYHLGMCVGGYVGAQTYFPVPMRATPALSWTDTVGASNKITTANQGTGRTVASGAPATGADARGFSTDLNTTDGSPGSWIRFEWVADARL